jgi:hypothetical protein
MSIKALYTSKEEIPEKYVDLYEERSGSYHLVKIDGLRTDADVSRVQTALNQEKAAHTAIKQKFEGLLGGKKVEEVQSLLDKIPELEAAAAGKVDDEKLNVIIESRLKTKISPIERERDQAKQRAAELEGKVSQFESLNKQRAIHDAVRAAATNSKILDSAKEDVLLLAERVFEINEEGKITAKDGVGTTPGIAPEVWLTEMLDKRPHWWPASVGGGARGGAGGKGFANNPWSADHWNMTEQNRLYNTLGAEKAKQLAESVGSFIGSARPPKK